MAVLNVPVWYETDPERPLMVCEIVTLRDSIGISQDQLAALTGVHVMTVSKWERGLLTPCAFQATLLRAYQRASQHESFHPRRIWKEVHGFLHEGKPLLAISLLLKWGAA